MQVIYKFRVAFEDHDDVVRFIDIDSTSNFADFHKIIQESIGFDGTKAYTFHMSNDFWRVDAQICDSEPREESAVKLPKLTILSRFINDPHQRFIYRFDPDLDWKFTIELVKIQKAEPFKKYPLLSRKEGEAPKQYKLKGKLPGAKANENEYDKMAEMLMASRLMEDILADDKLDSSGDLDEETTESPDFDAIKSKIALDPMPDKPSRSRVPIDLKFDDEDMKIDEEDLSFLEAEEGDDEHSEDEDDDDNDYEQQDDDENSEDY